VVPVPAGGSGHAAEAGSEGARGEPQQPGWSKGGLVPTRPPNPPSAGLGGTLWEAADRPDVATAGHHPAATAELADAPSWP
jgi:hypothetical protein